MGPTFADIMENIRALNADARQDLLDAVHAWVVEDRREAILRNAAETEMELERGLTKSGNIDALKADLYSDD
jgi:hypothetical protein